MNLKLSKKAEEKMMIIFQLVFDEFFKFYSLLLMTARIAEISLMISLTLRSIIVEIVTQPK